MLSSAQTGALYYNESETGNTLLSYSTGSYVGYNFHTKTGTDNLLADKSTNIGDISLPGMLDIGTSGYTSSRIICNVYIGGYTGYAELRAANSYDMFINLSTTRTDGGWMYFKNNNDNYVQLSNSGNKVNIYKDAAISGNLEPQRLTINKPSNDNDMPLQIINNNQSWFVASFENTIAEGGCLMQWIAPASSTYWWGGVWGANTNEFNTWFNYKGLSIKSNGSAAINENLDVGATCNNSITIHGTGATTSFAEFKVSNIQNCVWDFQNPSNSKAWSSIKVKGVKFMGFSPYDNITIHCKPFANWSDDRLKENEIFKESACETLSKLRPQLYDKKPDMENDDPKLGIKKVV